MSSTMRSADTAKKADEAKSGPDAMAANGKQTSAETVATAAAETVTALSSAVVEQSREAMTTGVRAAADFGGRVADIGFGRSHDALSSATHMMDIYRDASDRTAGGVQALFASWLATGRGLQKMQQAWLGIFDQTIENTGRNPQDLLRCKTMVEVAEVQRDLYVDAVNRAIGSSSRLLELISQTAQEAGRPMQNRPH
jgi:hypothetical protein